MDFSVPLNISTNAWNIIKFMAMYVLLDVTIPILLESIDKASIIRCFSRNGRVPIANFTKDRQVRSGVRELVTDMLRRFRKRPVLRRPQRAVKLRLLLLFSVWVASIIGEYGSGSEPRIIQVEVRQITAPVESIVQAMFSCVLVDRNGNNTKLQMLVRNATMTNEGLKCSCSYPAEVGCTMPVQVQRMDVISGIPLQDVEPEDLIKPEISIAPGHNYPLFRSSGPLQVEKYRKYSYGPYAQFENDRNGTAFIDYMLVQGHAKRCDMCSYLPVDVGPVHDILFRFYGTQDQAGNSTPLAMFSGKLPTGTLVGLAFTKRKSVTERDSLDDHFEINYFSMISFLPDVWEFPSWPNRAFETHHLTAPLTWAAIQTFKEQTFLGLDRKPDFSAIWSAWWLRGHMNNTLNGTVTLNTSSTETATISPLGIFSFSYVTALFLLLLVYSIASRKWRRLLKTNGYGNVDWLISALIAQQQLRGSSLRGVDDLEQFDLTVVKHDSGVPHVSAQHWIASLTLASPAKNIDVADGKKKINEEDNDEV